MNNDEITDHSLHLLVDNQLDSASKKKIKKEIELSPELQGRLKGITEVKELVALAYIQERPRTALAESKSSIAKGSFYAAFAASVMLVVGLTVGWFAHQQYDSEVYVVANSETRSETLRPQIPLEINLQNARKYMLHFDTLNENKLQSALLETRSILDSYANSGLPIKVDLLFDRESVEIFKPQHLSQITYLKNLITDYENINLFACSESIRLFLGDMKLTDDINLFHTSQVVKEMIPGRIEEGWVYIKA